jgi:hypothetical protein
MSCNKIASIINSINSDPSNNLKKIIKYLIQFFVVCLTAKWISTYKLDLQEIIIIGLTSSAVFVILDTYSPTILDRNNN